MDFKKSITQLLVALFLSPVIVYIVLMASKLAGSTYEMTNGETFINLVANGNYNKPFLS